MKNRIIIVLLISSIVLLGCENSCSPKTTRKPTSVHAKKSRWTQLNKKRMMKNIKTKHQIIVYDVDCENNLCQSKTIV